MPGILILSLNTMQDLDLFNVHDYVFEIKQEDFNKLSSRMMFTYDILKRGGHGLQVINQLTNQTRLFHLSCPIRHSRVHGDWWACIDKSCIPLFISK